MPYLTHMAKTHIPRAVVLAMRIQYEAGYTIMELRLAYGYSRQTISDLVHYKTHKRVRLGPNESRDVPPLPVTLASSSKVSSSSSAWAARIRDSADGSTSCTSARGPKSVRLPCSFGLALAMARSAR